jgi:ribosome-binding factor A
MSTKRMLQLGGQLREFIAILFARGEIRDPRLKNITIHSVKMTSDLQLAKVYYICSETDPLEREKVEAALKSAAPFIRKALGKELQIRYTPQIMFYYDDSIEYSLKMTSLLSQVRSEFVKEEEETHETKQDKSKEDV